MALFLLLFFVPVSFAAFGDISTASITFAPTTLTCVVTDGEFLYYGTSNSSIINLINLIKFDPISNTINNTRYLADVPSSAVIDGYYAYFGTNSAPGKVYRIDLRDFGSPLSITLKTGQNYLTSATIYEDYAYFGTYTSPGIIVRVDLLNFTHAGEFNFTHGILQNLITVIADGPIATWACEGSVVVTRMDLSNFTDLGYEVLSGYVDRLPYAAIYGSHVYFPGQYYSNLYQFGRDNLTNSFVAPLELAGTITGVYRENYMYLYTTSGKLILYNMELGQVALTREIGTTGITVGIRIGNKAYFAGYSSPYLQFIALDISKHCIDAPGGVLYDSETRNVYSTNVSTCNCEVGQIQCIDGNITGDISFQYANCTVEKDCNCSVSINSVMHTIVHNSSIIIYKEQSYCDCALIESEMFCFEGNVTVELPGYRYAVCASTRNCSCLGPLGMIIPHKESRTGYSVGTSPCMETCETYKTNVTCDNGKLLGTFRFNNCTECGVNPIALLTPINATLNIANSIILMRFPESPNVTVTFGAADSTNAQYRDPKVNAPGQFDGTSFFITFYENSIETHTPPPGTFLEISASNNDFLYYFDIELNKWIKNCVDPKIISDNKIQVELCHASQYAIFHLTFDTSQNSVIDITVIAIVIIVLVAIIAALIGAFVYYKKRLQKQKRQSSIEMVSVVTIKGVKVGHRLGNGNFGEVYKGEWKGTSVALKKLKTNSEEFVKESEMLSKLSHPNVVQYIGIYISESGEKYIVTEFMPQGDLLSLLRSDEHKKITSDALLQISRQAAAGMVYLEHENIVHRDLALRNFLVGSLDSNIIVKISDFGLSRTISDADNYYTKEGSQMPVKVPKWSAPESLKYGKFSSKSDIWSFGVCLWELFSRGEMPYFTMTNTEAIEKVQEGYRLPQPKECSDEMYKLMIKCWNASPEDRPTFVEVLDEIEKIVALTVKEVEEIKPTVALNDQDIYNN